MAWIDNSGNQHIGYFDHETKTFQKRLIRTVGDDDHSAPSLLVRNNGRIIVFLPSGTGHRNPLHCIISTNPEEIESFGSVTTVSNDQCAYPRPFQNKNGEIFVVFRYLLYHDGMSKSVDGGKTWSPPTTLVNFGSGKIVYGALYQELGDLDRIHYACLYWDATLKDRFNIYYMQSVDGGNSWRKIDGTPITLPATQPDMDLVWSVQTVRLHDIIADEESHTPHIVVAQPIARSQINYVRRLHYENGEWINETITPTKVFYYNPTAPEVNTYTAGAAIDPKNSDILYIAAASGDKTDMQKWEKINGGWRKTLDITSGAMAWCIRPFMPRNYHDELKLTWSYGSYTSFGVWNLDLYYLSEEAPPTTPGSSLKFKRTDLCKLNF